MPTPAADEDPNDVKEMCIKRVRGLLDYVSTCLSTFDFNSGIPHDLVTRAEDVLTSVFGDSSKEVQRYNAYADQWSSLDLSKRREWLERLRYDLKSAINRLESTPAQRYPALGLGSVENEAGTCSSINKRLGISGSGSIFSNRIIELCRRVQINIQHNSPDAAAYLLRKMLEVTIVERFRKDGRMKEIIRNGRVIGLDKLIGKASQSAGGLLHPNIVKSLLDDKLLMDTSVHSLSYDPSKQDLDRVISLIGVAVADLRIGEL